MRVFFLTIKICVYRFGKIKTQNWCVRVFLLLKGSKIINDVDNNKKKNISHACFSHEIESSNNYFSYYLTMSA